MLSREDNEALCRVGPGTLMGNLMRQYWVPALTSTELPGPDCNPVRVMLLGEKLIAFRDSSGRVGLLQNACPHRGASLFFGRNEADGLRCVYHGWKFDVSGRCVDMPNEPPESNFKDKVQARSYPCVEAAGLVWTYMGPREVLPPLPHFEAFDYPLEQVEHTTWLYRCNWAQAIDGSTDPTHAGILHMGHLNWEEETGLQRVRVQNRAPGQKLADIGAGVLCGAYYENHPDDPDQVYWSIGQWMFPFYRFSPTGKLGSKTQIQATVPMDDHHTIQLVASVRFDGHRIFRAGEYAGDRRLPNGTGWYDRYRWEQTIENDYLIDREKQRSMESYTGLDGNIIEDVMVTESMGPIYDHTQERLGTADAMIIRIRRRLLAAARALAEHGTAPPGVDDPDAYLVRAGLTSLPRDADWITETEALRGVTAVSPAS
jgi:phenylpropionate dioxygenase-like ring-hydroxylating dioxygenase large terminal subunit